MLASKGKGISVTINDRKAKESKSMTVHGLSVHEIYTRVHYLLSSLAEVEAGEEVNLRFYRSGKGR